MAAAEAAGAHWIHVDVMDGHFVPNLTFGPKMVADLRRVTTLPLDVHLMIEWPEHWIDRYADAGANYLTIHVESTRRVRETLEAIRLRKVGAGITLKPATPASDIAPYLDAVDLVLVMSVQPGLGGQVLIEGSLDKVRELRAMLDERRSPAELEVDGGIKPDNALSVVEAGATVLVAGSAVFLDTGGPSAAVEKFKKAVGRS